MATTLDVKTLASELMTAYRTRATVVAPSERDSSFGMADAYAVEAELVRMRKEAGHATLGLKVGYANKGMWRALKLETLVWAHMYDDTVQYADRNAASLSLGRTTAPKIEPEIVFRIKLPIEDATEPAAILASVEWLALGFEIIDCVFPDWQFRPVDFVAAFGLHAALVIGQPQEVESGTIPSLVEALPGFKLRLLKDGQLIEEGSGRNSLRSPALCLGELARTTRRQPAATPLVSGDLVSSGTLTTPAPILPGEIWTAEVEGLCLPALTLRTIA